MRRSVIIGGLLFFLDAFVLNQGVMALIILIVVLPIIGIRALINRKDKTLLKKRLAVCGTYFTVAVFILLSNAINNQIAESRARIIIEACEKYKSKNHFYPQKMSDLVPIFMDRIPVAKYTLLSNKFTYIASERSHLLFYVAFPPFGRPTYFFEKQEWKLVD